MSSGDGPLPEELDTPQMTKKQYQGNGIPQPEVSSDEDDPQNDDTDTEEVCLTRADIKEMQRIHEELE